MKKKAETKRKEITIEEIFISASGGLMSPERAKRIANKIRAKEKLISTLDTNVSIGKELIQRLIIQQHSTPDNIVRIGLDAIVNKQLANLIIGTNNTIEKHTKNENKRTEYRTYFINKLYSN